MNNPPLEDLVRRLIDIPAEFLAEPNFDAKHSGPASTSVDVAAVVSDTLIMIGDEALRADQAGHFRPTKSAPARNWLRSVLIGTWLVGYFDPTVSDDRRLNSEQTRSFASFLTNGLAHLAELVDAAHLVTDPERREELARLLVRELALLPAGETKAQAEDRLSTLDSVNRKRVMEQARAAEVRAAEVRRALESKRAAEAAAKSSRE